MTPEVKKFPIYNNIFTNVIAGYEKWLWCTSCDGPICSEYEDVPKRCPHCNKKIEYEGKW